MIDLYTVHVAFLIFESIFCILSALVYSLSRDPFRVRKNVILSLNISCGIMLLCEYLFHVYQGNVDTFAEVVIMWLINAGNYYLIELLLLFYTILISLRLFNRFDLKQDQPCRIRLGLVLAIVVIGMVLVTVSQFTGIYYFFDADNNYERGPLFWLSVLLPTIGGLIDASVIIQYRKQMTPSQLVILLSYVVLPLIGAIFQMIFYGNSLMSICFGLAVLMMFFENVVYKEKEIVRASKTEVRTGLANEHGYIEWLNSMKGKPELLNYSVVFFDLCKFSEINRKYGVRNGNRVLASFGNIMLGKIDEDEILGRQYGNVFLAIVKRQNLDRLLESLKGVEIPFLDEETKTEQTVTLSAHIGVYNIDRNDLDGEDILVLASLALSEAKDKVTDDIVWLTRDLIDSISKRKQLESDIQSGLGNGEFVPYYQPKVNTLTGELCGAEALSRWIHNGSVVSPGVYIPLMEANDTICLLDFRILEATCMDIAAWRSEGLNVPMISVNFSRRNLVDPDLASRIDAVVQRCGVPKELIEIEVTESSDEFSIGVLNNFVNSLHELGYKVSIDDFGNASSSLALLRQISFDTLKIDRGFVALVNEKDLTILTNIVRMADEINVDLVAEGAEQLSQLRVLNNLGVHVVQGYYFDKPLEKEVMKERLLSPHYPVEN